MKTAYSSWVNQNFPESAELFQPEFEEEAPGPELPFAEYEQRPTTVPTPGRFYAIQYGKGGLLTTASRAYRVEAGARRIWLAQQINNHSLNRKYWARPSNVFERRYFPDGIISFNPAFTCAAGQRRAKRGERMCFARIWIPAPPQPRDDSSCGVPWRAAPAETGREPVNGNLEQARRTTPPQPRPAVRPRIAVRSALCLFQDHGNPKVRAHYKCGAERQAKQIGAIVSPSAVNCRPRVGPTPYKTGGDIIKAINATYRCLRKPVELIHIFGHGVPDGIPGVVKGRYFGLYKKSYPLVEATNKQGRKTERDRGGRTVSDVPTEPLSDNVVLILHGCNLANIAAGKDNFARSLYQRLAGSLSNPKVYAHYDRGCASRNKSWRVYSKDYPAGYNVATNPYYPSSVRCC